MDIGQLIRLRASVKAAMESVPEGLAGTGGTALSEAYARSRIEVESLIEGSDLVEEFNRLFQRYQPTVGRRDLLGQARTYGEARTHLARLRCRAHWTAPCGSHPHDGRSRDE